MKAQLTDKTARHYLDSEWKMPVAELKVEALGVDSPIPGDVIDVDGEPFYYADDAAGFEYGRLCRKAHEVDHGGNVYTTRTAPESTTGILRHSRLNTTVSYSGDTYWLKVTPNPESKYYRVSHAVDIHKLRKLKGFGLMTPEEADVAYDAAPADPISDKEIDSMIKFATSGEPRPYLDSRHTDN